MKKIIFLLLILSNFILFGHWEPWQEETRDGFREIVALNYDSEEELEIYFSVNKLENSLNIVIAFSPDNVTSKTEINNYQLKCKVDNNNPIVLKCIATENLIAASMRFDKNVEKVIGQMKKGKNLTITMKINDKERIENVPLENFSKLYQKVLEKQFAKGLC